MVSLAEIYAAQAEGGPNARIDNRLMQNLAEQMIAEAGSAEGITPETMEAAQGLSEPDKERLSTELGRVVGGDQRFMGEAINNLSRRTGHSISPETGESFTGDEIRAYHQPTTQDPNKLQDPGLVEILARTADTVRAEAADGEYSRSDAVAISDVAKDAVAARMDYWQEQIPQIMAQVNGVEGPVVAPERAAPAPAAGALDI